MKKMLFVLLLALVQVVGISQNNVPVSQLPVLVPDSVTPGDFFPVVHFGHYYRLRLGALDSVQGVYAGAHPAGEVVVGNNRNDTSYVDLTYNSATGVLNLFNGKMNITNSNGNIIQWGINPQGSVFDMYDNNSNGEIHVDSSTAYLFGGGGGNVGIGTAAPTALLHIHGTETPFDFRVRDDRGDVEFVNGNGNSIVYGFDGTGSYFYSSNADATYNLYSDSILTYMATTPGSFVGIGTATPQYNLDVWGTATEYFIVDDADGITAWGDNNGSVNGFRLINNPSTQELTLVEANGAQKLFYIEGNTHNAYMSFGNGGGSRISTWGITLHGINDSVSLVPSPAGNSYTIQTPGPIGLPGQFLKDSVTSAGEIISNWDISTPALDSATIYALAAAQTGQTYYCTNCRGNVGVSGPALVGGLVSWTGALWRRNF